ncbi:MAG TPA: cyclic nucleotide-binding domain-containing protein [Methylibium sp.]|nr:cyclic nucleotide-binding domain-containing protein [Methylibium sp.]
MSDATPQLGHPAPGGTAPAVSPLWQRTLGSAGAALSSALTHAPENAAYGLMALAPLGAAYGPMAMGLAILGSVVGCACASTLGAGRLVDDAGAALALLTAGLVATLVTLVPAGPQAAWTVLILTALGIAAAGVLTVLCGLLRIGGVVKFTPFAVRVGLSTGIGLLLITSAAPALLGSEFNAGWAGARAVQPGALAVGTVALLASLLAARLRSRVPAVLLGLAAATVLQLLLTWSGGDATLGRTVGVPELPARWFGGAFADAAWRAALGQPAVLLALGGYAVTAAVVVLLDTLLAASVVDGRLRCPPRNASRELVAQGLANLASAAAGGLPASPALPASLGLVAQRPADRHVVLAYALALLALLVLLPQALGLLPVAAVAGVLVYLGLLMVSPTLWQTPRELWRLHGGAARHRGADPRRALHLAGDWVATVAVALAALLLGLGHAVLIGASLAVLLFVRSNMRDVVRQAWSVDQRHSLKHRAPAVAEVLRREGRRIALLELEGALFFGTADALRARLHALAPQVDTAILDLHQVREVDVTAARILHETAEDWAAQGKPLVFAECGAGDPRRGLIESVAGAPGAAGLHFADTVDLALEQAEDALLERLQVERADGTPLALADTMIARGLTAEELARLAAETSTHTFRRGELLFRAGDAGDALYISLCGEIGLRVPGTTRRLASFAPGVTIGEIALLSHAPRSAEAYAETDVVALGLPVEAFERLTRTQPALAAKLLANIALHLADRVRMLTGDLAGWMSRAAAARPPA